MISVKIPPRLRSLLDDSPLEAPTLQFVNAVSVVLSDNKTPFFPAYTDHGPEHVERVMAAAVQLVPANVWDERLLGAPDAAILVCAALLHDLALHFREQGFVELISDTPPRRPLPWFSDTQPGRAADQPWDVTWRDFREEARHLGASQLDGLLGPDNSGVPAIAFDGVDQDPSTWIEADRLLVGDFLRRHHARIAHEIAIYGLPGVPPEEFPRLADTLPDIADAIGVTARSHNEDLRTMVAYCEYVHGGSRQPWGAFVPYAMGLLRIADYFQLDADRAPPLLLRLKAPTSRVSVDEWNLHGALSHIGWGHRDGEAIYVAASPKQQIRTHLRLHELVADIQRELDTTGAVLSEAYDTPELSALRLSRQRIRTNLDEPSLHAQLPFVPVRASLRSDEDLFRLVIADLYGDHPAVAGRELLQNAADAVRARNRWETSAGAQVDPKQLRDQDADIVLRVVAEPDGKAVLCVSDKGIGMEPATVRDFYLSAGASFGPTAADFDSLAPAKSAAWMKAGRFGIGVFAGFLLGESIEVRTRHASADRGIEFTAHLSGDVVELKWADMPVGTQVRIPFSRATLARADGGEDNPDMSWKRLLTRFVREMISYYRLSSPTVECECVFDDGTVKRFDERDDVPLPGGPVPDTWHTVDAPGFDGVFWSYLGFDTHPLTDYVELAHLSGTSVSTRVPYTHGEVVHNGLAINGDRGRSSQSFGWSNRALATLLGRPRIAVFDSRHLLGLTLTRYGMRSSELPFEAELQKSIGLDVVASALASGARRHELGDSWGIRPVFARREWIPFLPSLVARYVRGHLCVLWGDWEAPTRPWEKPFVSPRGGVSWRRLPHRIVLLPVSGNDLPDRTSSWDLSEDGNLHAGLVNTCIEQLRWSFGLEPVMSLALTWGKPPREFEWSADPDSDWGDGKPWASAELEATDGLPDGTALHTRLETADQAEAKRWTADLFAAARELLRGDEGAIALSVLRVGETGAADDGALAKPWADTLDGWVPRNAGRRKERAIELAAAFPSLGGAIEKRGGP